MNHKIKQLTIFLSACSVTASVSFAQSSRPADLAPGKPDYAPKRELAPGKPDAAAKPESRDTPSPTALIGVYRLIKNRYIPFGDDYAPLRSFDASKPSSRGATVDDLIKSSAKTVREQLTKNMVRERTVQLTAVEAAALAYPLPNLAPGNYGYVLGGTVQKVIDKDTVILSDIQLINEEELRRLKEDTEREAQRRERNNKDRANDTYDSDRRASDKGFEQRTRLADLQREGTFRVRVRLHGFSTESAVEKSRWNGPPRSNVKSVPTAEPAGPNNSQLHIAIVGVGEEDDKKPAQANAPAKQASGPPTVGQSNKTTGKRSGKRVYEAVPVEYFVKGITEDEFKDLLVKRGISQQEFLELAQKEIRRNPDEAPDRIVDAIERKREESEKQEK